MATTDQNKIDRERALNLLNNVKPCFSTSNSRIFYQLHVAAQQQAADKLKISANDPNINQFIINTGISEDGKTIAEGGEKHKLFHVGNNKYEIGIVMQFTDYKAPLNKDLKDKAHPLKEILKYNESKGTLKEFKTMIVDALIEYCKWFWGDDTYRVDESSVQEFIPDYDGGKIRLNGGEIVSMDEKDMLQYLKNRNTTDYKTVKAVKANGGEKVESEDKDGNKVVNTAEKDMWIIDNSRLMDDSNFQNTYEKSKDGKADTYVEKNSVKDDKTSENYAKPRIGYKIGYEIKY